MISLPLLLCLLRPAPACDGEPPVLENRDAVAHAYLLTCGARVEQRSVAAGERQVLEGFSGCVLKLGEHSATLHTEMACAVATGGVLACELL